MEALPAEDGEAPLSINRYFIENPEMVLGRHARTSSSFGPAYSCLPDPGARLEALLAAAIDRLPQAICKAPSEQIQALPPAQPNLRVGTAAEGATIKEGSYILDNNELFQVIPTSPTECDICDFWGV
jgi:N12 class adenine-specific DNA methylase